MNLDTVICGDLEADGLLDTATKIHVFSFGLNPDSICSTPSYDLMKTVFSDPEVTIAIHNGVRFDVPLVEKILGIKVKATVIDTLSISWYIDCGRSWDQYGLAWYGELFGVPKPTISSWTDLTYDEYRHRNIEDTKITIQLWNKLLTKLRLVYDDDSEIVRVIKYLNFIMECSRHQEEQKIEIDVEKVRSNMEYFDSLKEAKVSQLREAMPKIPITRIVKRPKSLYRADGKLSVAGQKWQEVLPPQDDDLTKHEVEVITGYEIANPNSVPQKKAWLYSLGWKPQTFKYNRDKKTGKTKKIEQILTEEKELCPSVLKLKDKEPAIELLDGISVLTHRIGIFKSLLENNVDGFIVQGLSQLAVSLRWQHSVVVNFPRVTGKGDIRDGKWIRECLIAGDGNKLVQSDLSGIESRTSDHYTFPLNPELIKETQAPYFDPHTKIAVASNLMTKDEEIWFKWKKENKDRKEKGEPELPVEVFGNLSPTFHVDDEVKLMNKLKEARSKAKTTNYASLYLVGATRLSLSLEISKREAQKLIDAYWAVHWAVRKVTEMFHVKRVGEELWILNPISKFRHHLRNEKDAFSTVNQSSAVYAFNMWVFNITRSGYWPILQTHDDLCLRVREWEVDIAKEVVDKAMKDLNKHLKLNVPLDCEIQVGASLDKTH
jgi:hypothetical protein